MDGFRSDFFVNLSRGSGRGSFQAVFVVEFDNSVEFLLFWDAILE